MMHATQLRAAPKIGKARARRRKPTCSAASCSSFLELESCRAETEKCSIATLEVISLRRREVVQAVGVTAPDHDKMTRVPSRRLLYFTHCGAKRSRGAGQRAQASHKYELYDLTRLVKRPQRPKARAYSESSSL